MGASHSHRGSSGTASASSRSVAVAPPLSIEILPREKPYFQALVPFALQLELHFSSDCWFSVLPHELLDVIGGYLEMEQRRPSTKPFLQQTKYLLPDWTLSSVDSLTSQVVGDQLVVLCNSTESRFRGLQVIDPKQRVMWRSSNMITQPQGTRRDKGEWVHFCVTPTLVVVLESINSTLTVFKPSLAPPMCAFSLPTVYHLCSLGSRVLLLARFQQSPAGIYELNMADLRHPVLRAALPLAECDQHSRIYAFAGTRLVTILVVASTELYAVTLDTRATNAAAPLIKRMDRKPTRGEDPSPIAVGQQLLFQIGGVAHILSLHDPALDARTVQFELTPELRPLLACRLLRYSDGSSPAVAVAVLTCGDVANQRVLLATALLDAQGYLVRGAAAVANANLTAAPNGLAAHGRSVVASLPTGGVRVIDAYANRLTSTFERSDAKRTPGLLLTDDRVCIADESCVCLRDARPNEVFGN